MGSTGGGCDGVNTAVLQLLCTGFLWDAEEKKFHMESLSVFSLCGHSLLVSPGHFLSCPILL